MKTCYNTSKCLYSHLFKRGKTKWACQEQSDQAGSPGDADVCWRAPPLASTPTGSGPSILRFHPGYLGHLALKIKWTVINYRGRKNVELKICTLRQGRKLITPLPAALTSTQKGLCFQGDKMCPLLQPRTRTPESSGILRVQGKREVINLSAFPN